MPAAAAFDGSFGKHDALVGGTRAGVQICGPHGLPACVVCVAQLRVATTGGVPRGALRRQGPRGARLRQGTHSRGVYRRSRTKPSFAERTKANAIRTRRSTANVVYFADAVTVSVRLMTRPRARVILLLNLTCKPVHHDSIGLRPQLGLSREVQRLFQVHKQSVQPARQVVTSQLRAKLGELLLEAPIDGE